MLERESQWTRILLVARPRRTVTAWLSANRTIYLIKTSNIPIRCVLNRSQCPRCTAVMRRRCQRSRIAAWNRHTATLLGARFFLLGPEPVNDFYAYRGLVENKQTSEFVSTSCACLTSRRRTIVCSDVCDGSKSMATSAMDMGSTNSIAGEQSAEDEASEDGEEREKIVVEWRLRVRVKGMEDLFLIRGRIVRGTFTSGDEVMRAFKSCWSVTRPEDVINGTGDVGMGVWLTGGLGEVINVSSRRIPDRVLYLIMLVKAMLWRSLDRMRRSVEGQEQAGSFAPRWCREWHGASGKRTKAELSMR